MARSLGDKQRMAGEVRLPGDRGVQMGLPWRLLYTDADEFPLTAAMLAKARRLGLDLVPLNGHSQNDLIGHGQDCVGAFLYRGRIDDVVLAAVPRWRVVVRIGTGYELIDVDAAMRHGVTVTYVPGYCADEMALTALSMILAFARQLPVFIEASQSRRWLKAAELPSMRRLAGRSLGILGFGHSGQSLGRKASAIGLDVRAWSRELRTADLLAAGVRGASFEDAIQADYVSLHLPLTPETSHLIDSSALAAFRKRSVLINVARGGLVDTAALVDAIGCGRIAGAGLDVVDPQPLPPDHPLWGFPNVLLTHHSASLSVEGARSARTQALEDAAAVLAGGTPRYPVPEMRAPRRN